jgi:branched-chain amino acid aminotransferase
VPTLRPLVIINGKITDKISVFDHGFLYGDGVFDTYRIFNGKSFFIKEHLERLYKSAKGANIKIPVTKAKLAKLLSHHYKKFGQKDAFVRVIVTKGKGNQGLSSKTVPTLIMIFAKRDFNPLGKINAVISPIKKFSQDSSGRTIKGLNYGLAAQVLSKAKGAKVKAVIFLNERGKITEAATSNIFLAKNNRLFTPPLKSGLLPGVTRQLVLKYFRVTQKELTLRDLLAADEVFLTGTADFVTSIKSIGRKVYKRFDYAKVVFKKLFFLI